MHAAVAKKTDQIARAITNSGLAAGTQRFLNDSTLNTTQARADKTTVSTLYSHLQKFFQVEYVTLVDKDYNIVYSANKGVRNDSVYFNPDGTYDGPMHYCDKVERSVYHICEGSGRSLLTALSLSHSMPLLLCCLHTLLCSNVCCCC